MSCYLITGATGYIGSTLTEILVKQGEQVVVLVRDPLRLAESIRSKVSLYAGDITDVNILGEIKENIDYVIHCAAPTQSLYIKMHPVETSKIIFDGTQNVLEFARKREIKSMVFLSSMEVYGKFNEAIECRIEETVLGEIDLFNSRNAYPISKRMAENLCYAYFEEYGVPVKIARLAQVFGKKIEREDQRVFAQFIKAVKENKSIVLHTEGESMGNYCDMDDAIEGIFFILKNGGNGNVYNVVNENNTMKIKEMAELVAEKIAKREISVVYDIPKENRYGYAIETKLKLSGEKLRRLGWEAKTSLIEMYKKML